MTGAADPEATAVVSGTEGTVASDPGASRSGTRNDQPLGPGVQIGRYVVLQRLGAGAMGVVLAAFDPELDRKVAIKLLKMASRGAETARARLQREAQALAKLAHPNVVAVHDVGNYGGDVFVAMEYVAGGTLGEWRTSQPRTVAEILAVFVAAGRGLAAAHDAGLVHRDFKPDNVMVGDDGRVRVMDFGLARTDGDAEGQPEASTQSTIPDEVGPQTESGAGSSASLTSLTRTGAVLGTPAYMAPEQFAGIGADARSDQFGYCVALWEALFGERPFAGNNFAALMMAVTEGRYREPPASTPAVKPWLRRVVQRGLAVSAEDRWPSMDALLAAISDDPTAKRRRALAGVAVAASLAGGTWAVRSATVEPRAPLCQGTAEAMAALWNPERRTEIEDRIRAGEFSYAESTAQRAGAALDTWADGWASQRLEACQATQVRGEQSAEAMDLRMSCLDDRLVRFGATVDVLAEADTGVARKAASIAERLPPLARCADLEALRAAQPPPEDPQVAAKVDALRVAMARASALQLAGKYDDGLKIIADVVLEAEGLEYAPLIAEAALNEGLLHRGAANHEEAEAALTRAYTVALSHGDLETARNASRLVMTVVGQILARYDDAHQWAIHARALADASGSELARAEFLANYGDLAGAQGNYQKAFDLHAEALEIRERLLTPDSLQMATSLSNTAAASKELGRGEEARAYLERALGILERSYGPDHPQVGDVLHNLGIIASEAGDNDAGRAFYDRSLAVRELALGPDHPNVALTLNSLGVLAYEQNDLGSARRYEERALGIYEAKFGSEHPSLAAPLANLANVHKAGGDMVGARALLERAMAISEKASGPDHPSVGFGLHNLGNLVRLAGDPAAALVHHQRALDIFVAAKIPAPIRAYALTGKGEDLLDLGRPVDALEPLEAALRIRAEHEKDRGEIAQTRFALARALWDAPGGRRDRTRGRELAAAARDDYASTGEPHAEDLKAVDGWIASHDAAGSGGQP